MTWAYLYYFRKFKRKDLNRIKLHNNYPTTSDELAEYNNANAIISYCALFVLIILGLSYIILFIPGVNDFLENKGINLWVKYIPITVSFILLMVLMIVSEIYRNKYAKEKLEDNYTNMRNKVLYCLFMANIKTQKQLESLIKLMEMELKRSEISINSYNNKIGIILGALIASPFSINIKNISIALIITAYICGLILVIYYLVIKNYSSTCYCTIDTIFQALDELHYFSDDKNLIADVKNIVYKNNK